MTSGGIVSVGVATAVDRGDEREEGHARDPSIAAASLRRFAYTAAHATTKVLCRAIADAAALGLLAPPRECDRDRDRK